jgi:hypothetical protein
MRITTVCPRCGRVDLPSDEVTLVVNPHQDSARYLFDCIGCAHQVVQAASGLVVTTFTLLSISVWTVPAEVSEREPLEREWPPITVDDLLDTMLWLRHHQDLSQTDLPTRCLVES